MRAGMCLLIGVLLIMSALAAGAAPNYIGPSGLLLSPDDTIANYRDFNVFYHAVFDDVGFGSIQHLWGANLGFPRSVEVGFLGATNVTGNGTDFAVNGKWRIVGETMTQPGVAIGVWDTFDQLDGPTVYFAVGKDFAPILQHWFGSSIPIRLNAGVGSGIYRNGFIGANWIFSRRLQLMAEYVGTRFPTTSDTGGNIGLRYAVTSGLRADVGLLDFQNFSIGFSYTGSLATFSH